MKKRNVFILAATMFLIAAIVTVLVACDTAKQESEVENKTKDDNIECVFTDDKITAPGYDDGYVDNELPPESFVGTVIEEDTYYMIVEPNADEEEYNLSTKIRVEYLNDHIDYLYGIGRKVVITYIPPLAGGTTITTDDIRCDGFEDFTLSVQYRQDSIPANFAEIAYAGFLTLVANNRDFDEYVSDYNLYYYGLNDVYVTVDGATLSLKEALSYGKVTIDGIIAECNRLASIGEIEEISYDDGGSSLFDFGDFRIIKYHTLDGYRDVYIGTSEMTINAQGSRGLCIGGYNYKDWGIKLSAKDVTPDGATLVFNQKGGNVTGSLQTGDAFFLERLGENKWISYPTRPTIDFAWHQVAYMINHGDETEFETEWKWLYDSLPEGQYRIAKEVMDFRGTGDYDKQFFYAYFEI